MTPTFFDLLRELRDGGVETELDAAIRAVVHAVTLTGRRGEVRLTVHVKPAGKHNTDLLLVEDRIETKEPKPDRVASFVYPLPDGSLSRRDPRQPDLPNVRELAPVSPFPRDLDDADAQPRYRGEGGS